MRRAGATILLRRIAPSTTQGVSLSPTESAAWCDPLYRRPPSASRIRHLSFSPSRHPMKMTYTANEVAQRDSPSESYWVIIEGYVVDLTSFLNHHPGSTRKIIQQRKKSVDVTSNFVDHFGHTVRTFREACRQFDASGEPVVFQFQERNGVEVRIVGKIV